MKKPRRTPIVIALTAVLVGTFVVSSLVFPASAAQPIPSGHWIDNLGPGTTAAEFSGGNSHSDCTLPRFTSGTSDLWVFEISGASDPTSIPTWDAIVPAWTSSSPVVVEDVTAQYGQYLPDVSTKHLYIETTPAGARLNAAHLLYAGTSTSEVLQHTCSSLLRIDLTGELQASYDLAYQWDLDADVEWTAVDAYTYDISYSAVKHRSEVPHVQSNSIHVRGQFQLANDVLQPTDATVDYETYGIKQQCSIERTTRSFDCPIDSTSMPVDSLTGRPTGIGSVVITAQTSLGSVQGQFPIDWQYVEPSTILATDATIKNHAAMAAEKEVAVSTLATVNFYRETWNPASDYCSTHMQTFELIPGPSGPVPTDITTTALTWCRPRPGYSLQYLGGPYGIPMLIANAENLRLSYPTALESLPPLTNRDEVRSFLGSVACLDSCDALFSAQFLTAAFNALDPSFAEQQILIRDTCLTVNDYLHQVDQEFPRLDRTATVVRKAELERINGALVTTCPTVTTSTGIASTSGAT